MLFADFQNAVPPIVRLLLAIGITVGLAVLLVHVFHDRILKVNAAPAKKADDADPDPAPGVKDISGRLIALTTFAFVFLLGFGFSQFWGTAKDARDAVLNEAIDYQRVVGEAQRLPAGQGTAVLEALEAYRAGVVAIEWPLMEDADSEALAAARYEAGASLLEVLYSARTSDDAGNPVWTRLSSSVDDLLSDGVDRTTALPSPMAVSVIMLVFVLGIANLVAIARVQPARKRANLAIVAMMAAITGLLLFAIVEISNPYTGAGAITSQLLER